MDANQSNGSNPIINSSNIILSITRLLKDVLDKPNSIKSIKNYDLCMQNIQNLMYNNYYNNSNSNNNEFEEGSEELKLCEKTITENKLKELNLPEHEEVKLILQMAISSFRNAYLAFEHQHKKLLNTYLAFIKGWIKSTNANIKRDLTVKLMQNTNQMCFNFHFHFVLINENILDLDEYQEFIINYLEAPHIQKQCFNLLNGLKKSKLYDPSNNNRFPKLLPFFL